MGLTLSDEGAAKYAYNVQLLANPVELFQIHLHELTHRVSNQDDYQSAFQEALLVLGGDRLLGQVGLLRD